MKSAFAVIGSLWGDENKGGFTNHLSDDQTTVVRFNGGSQAGHTVQLADGTRHVFSHFGSGTLKGAKTFLSRFFISNPFMFREEWNALTDASFTPSVIIDPRSLVTTRYDMLINRVLEDSRGDGRHGSCGLGINETLVRSKYPEFRIRANLADASATLRRIQTEWVPRRLAELGLSLSEVWHTRWQSETHFEQNIADAEFMLKHATLATAWPSSDKVVFEGAQGLLLDENHYYFPHVTHSHTGLINVRILARENNIDHLNVTYALRAYATRHGAGPFPHEVPGLRYADPTNEPNDWQGTMRFGRLDVDLLRKTINNDRYRDFEAISISSTLAVSCLDQVPIAVTYWDRGASQTTAIEPFLYRLSTSIAPVRYISDGPGADHIHDWIA